MLVIPKTQQENDDPVISVESYKYVLDIEMSTL